MRNPEETRQEILTAAFWQVYQHGFQATSVNDILAKTSVTKGAFFHYFPTKNDLGYALVDEILCEMILDRWIRPLSKYHNPVQGILKQLKKIIDEASDDSLALGCPLNNLVQEMSPIDPIFRQKLLAALELWITEIDKQLQLAQHKGLILQNVSTRQTAEFIVMTHEGGFGMAKIYQSKKIFLSLYRSLKKHLEAIVLAP